MNLPAATAVDAETDQQAIVLLIAASASGQGKTSITAALARQFIRQGKRVRVLKTGPDFIDPMMLAQACGAPVQTLDYWMVGPALCQQYLAAAVRQADIVLIEGVMGLYDGTPSAADLARAFEVPVLLVLDAAAMAQTAGALVHGLASYGPVQLVGVIANKVGSSGHAQMIAASLRDCPLLGFLPHQPKTLPERHMGLVLPAEVDEIDTLLSTLADNLQLDQQAWQSLPVSRFTPPDLPAVPALLAGKTIAIARDAAFAFIYPANLDCLQQLGASLTFFSPLANQAVPQEADAVYLPGGYPELHAQTLQDATLWQASIRAVQGSGIPILAECGGMMALCEYLIDKEGRTFTMAGVLQGGVRMQQRFAALGPQGWSVPANAGIADPVAAAASQLQLRGHTFHFSRFDTSLIPFAHANRHPSGAQGEAIYRLGNLTASYFHAYFPSCPQAVAWLFGARQQQLEPLSCAA